MSIMNKGQILKYEAVLRRGKLPPNIKEKDINDFIDFICNVVEQQDIFFSGDLFMEKT